jgi:aldose 1-epimerase
MDEVSIVDGPIEIVVLPEVGARIHRLRAFGHDLLRTPADPAEHLRDPFFWGAYPMAPWCNRIDARPTTVGDRTVDLAANFPDGTAIHGQVYDRPWASTDRASFMTRGGGDGWPWAYEARLLVAVAGGTIRVDLAITNLADDPMPAGIGIHPWFRRPLEVAIHAERVHASMATLAPEPETVAGPYDLRSLGPIADDLDATWTDVADPAVVLHWPHRGIRATMRVVAPTICVVAASPSHIDAIAVEPQTHAPRGLRRLLAGEPDGLALLSPGQTLGLTMELAIERT